MKIPEFLFRFINPLVKALLNSPLHSLLSDSVLVLYYQGRRSGRALSTPVRYLQEENQLLLITSRSGGWWPNFKEAQRVEVQLAGARLAARASAYEPPDPMVRASIITMLEAHPADAAYLDIQRDKGSAAVAGMWEATSFEAAVDASIVVKIELVDDQRRGPV